MVLTVPDFVNLYIGLIKKKIPCFFPVNILRRSSNTIRIFSTKTDWGPGCRLQIIYWITGLILRWWGWNTNMKIPDRKKRYWYQLNLVS